MDPYESEFSHRMAVYWCIFVVFIGVPATCGTLIVLRMLGVL